MDKLQLYITITYNGFKQMVDINPDEYIKDQVVDVSEALNQISYNPQEKNIFYLLRSIDEGSFITILRTIPDKSGDHLSAWIYIPAHLIVPDEDIDEIVDAVVKVISNPKISTADMNTLRDIFDREYDITRHASYAIANHGNEYAHRFYGLDSGYMLSDLIGKERNLPSYLKYAGILLIDKAITTDVQGPDLTNGEERMTEGRMTEDNETEPETTEIAIDVIESAPEQSEIETEATETTVWEEISEKTEVEIESTKEEELLIDEAEESALSETTISPVEADTKAEIEPASKTEAEAEDETKIEPKREIKPETEDEIKTWNTPEPSVIAENMIQDTHKHKEAVTQEPKKDEIKHEPRTSNMHSYIFEVPAKSAAIAGMINFEVNTRSILTESPIDGYVCDSEIQEGTARINYLRFEGGEDQQKNLIWGIAGLIAGIVLTLLCSMIFSGSDAKDKVIDVSNDSITATSTQANDTNTTKAQQADQPEAVQTPKDTSLSAAITYLDTNETWKKSELESYPDLKGLYDDMNSFNHKRLYDHWNTKLKESRRFNKIAEHARLGQKKKPRDGKTKFNTDNDQSISVRTYLNTIDP